MFINYGFWSRPLLSEDLRCSVWGLGCRCWVWGISLGLCRCVCVQDDDDFDCILENQRVADQSRPKDDQPVFSPKRKREALPDQAYQLRKERTEGLMQGLRNVREHPRRPHSPDSTWIEEPRRYADEKGAERNRERKTLCLSDTVVCDEISVPTKSKPVLLNLFPSHAL
jgi:hypothetical protein